MNKNLEKILNYSLIVPVIAINFIIYSFARLAIDYKTLNPKKIIQDSRKFNSEKYETKLAEDLSKNYYFSNFNK